MYSIYYIAYSTLSKVGRFWKKKFVHFPCCAKLLQDPKSKITQINVAYQLVAWPQKSLTVTLKTTANFCLKYVLKPATGGIVFLDFLKLKIKRYSPKNLFCYCLDQNRFVLFWKITPKNFLKLIFFWQLFFDVKGRVMHLKISKFFWSL